MASNRAVVVSQLGTMLEQAARSSVARGAAYEPGEKINLDSQAGWNAVAESLVAMVEVMLAKGGNLDKVDGQS